RQPGQVGQIAAVGRDHHVHRLAVDEVGDGRGEVLLLQRRRAETGAGRGAEHQRVGGAETGGELAGGGVAEVAVVLVTHRHAGGEALGEVGFDVGVSGPAVAAVAAGVAGTEAGEALAAGVAAVGGAVVVEVGTRLAGEDLVTLVAALQTEGDVEATEDMVVETVDVEIHRVLFEREPAGVEAARAHALAAVEQVEIGQRGVEG
ncbi:hypothetical protein CATMIT_01957, partial [Catenibacterium mitsuokai DSM 15897]